MSQNSCHSVNSISEFTFLVTGVTKYHCIHTTQSCHEEWPVGIKSRRFSNDIAATSCLLKLIILYKLDVFFLFFKEVMNQINPSCHSLLFSVVIIILVLFSAAWPVLFVLFSMRLRLNGILVNLALWTSSS